MNSEYAVILRYFTGQKMPEMAALLRDCRLKVIQRWDEAVRETVPRVDELTTRQVRDSIPVVLEQLALVLERADRETTAEYYRMSTAHGVVRYHESFSMDNVMTEYRILRVVLLEEVGAQRERIPDEMREAQFIALAAGIDVALQQATLGFVHFQQEQLRTANAAEATYLSFLSHDLRNNLNNVTLTMDLLASRLESQPEFAEDYESLLAARRSIWETMDGMERLMQAERLKRKAVDPKFARVTVYPLVERVISTMLPRIEEKSLLVKNEIPENLILHTDEQLLLLVLQNLLGNAIKYSDGGSIWIRAALGGKERTQWTIEVQDSGRGIPEAERTRLFDAFHRGDTHGQPGVGLGLAIVASAAKLLRAEVDVISTPGKGSTFTVQLPAEAYVRPGE